MKNCTMSRELYWHFNSCHVAIAVLYVTLLEMDTNSGEGHLQGQSDNVASRFHQTLVSTFQLLCVTTQMTKICVGFLHKSQQYSVTTCNLSKFEKVQLPNWVTIYHSFLQMVKQLSVLIIYLLIYLLFSLKQNWKCWPPGEGCVLHASFRLEHNFR
jgi:uncharacterized membrane protein YhaH (DUF805 family)